MPAAAGGGDGGDRGDAGVDRDRWLDALAARRVVVIGEAHDRYEQHLVQLAVICGLRERGLDVAVGLEAFQQPFQAVLDDYVAGRIDLRTALARSEYYERWRFDHRLYAPILEYARSQRLPLVALNVPVEITRKVGRGGIESLDARERAAIPVHIPAPSEAYRARLAAILDLHPDPGGRDPDRFVQVQSLWDEGMAERAVRHLADNPRSTLVVIAGVGHVGYEGAIPDRIRRRGQPSVATVISADALEHQASADYVFEVEPLEAPRGGLLGVMVRVDGSRVLVDAFSDDSAARDAGLLPGDRLVSVQGRPVSRFADVRLALLDTVPGDEAALEVERDRPQSPPMRMAVRFFLR